MCIRLTRAMPDAVLLIDDRAVIHHRVPAARERFRYFRTRAYAEGLSKALVAGSVGAQDGLATERRYVTRVLPAGVARGVRDALLARPGGAGRAGAIVAGVAAAAGGYALGSVRVRRGAGRFVIPAAIAPPGEADGEADRAFGGDGRGEEDDRDKGDDGGVRGHGDDGEQGRHRSRGGERT